MKRKPSIGDWITAILQTLVSGYAIYLAAFEHQYDRAAYCMALAIYIRMTLTNPLPFYDDVEEKQTTSRIEDV